MGIVTAHKAIGLISTSSDPRKAIQDTVGDLSGFELFGDRVLVGIFMRPEKTKGGIIRPDSNKEEDLYQGKVGLVLKWGTDAFKDPETGELYNKVVNVGEWAVFYVGDGRQIQVNGMPCRIIRDSNISGKILDPMIIF